MEDHRNLANLEIGIDVDEEEALLRQPDLINWAALHEQQVHFQTVIDSSKQLIGLIGTVKYMHHTDTLWILPASLAVGIRQHDRKQDGKSDSVYDGLLHDVIDQLNKSPTDQ